MLKVPGSTLKYKNNCDSFCEDVYGQCTASDSGLIEKIINVDEENYVFNDFKKQTIYKLNKILYKLDTMQNKMNLLEEKMLYPVNADEEFINVQLPISLYEDLLLFEEQLSEERFKNKLINILKLVGGSNPHVMIRNMLKKLLTNTLAQQFSWVGKKAKRSFKDLRLANVIIQAVRTVHNQITDTEIANSIAKWLTQGTLRVQRENN